MLAGTLLCKKLSEKLLFSLITLMPCVTFSSKKVINKDKEVVPRKNEDDEVWGNRHPLAGVNIVLANHTCIYILLIIAEIFVFCKNIRHVHEALLVVIACYAACFNILLRSFCGYFMQ